MIQYSLLNIIYIPYIFLFSNTFTKHYKTIQKGVVMKELITMYKLMVLYMLSRVTLPLSKTQISDFLLEQEYTNYFTLQLILADCLESGLIREEKTYQKSTYYITDEGRETVEYFKFNITPSIIVDIDNHLKSKQYDIREDSTISANYYRNSNLEYSVNLKVIEKNVPVIDLTISVPTLELAESIANSWPTMNQEIYAFLMSKFLH